jgi:hypothetical protein
VLADDSALFSRALAPFKNLKLLGLVDIYYSRLRIGTSARLQEEIERMLLKGTAEDPEKDISIPEVQIFLDHGVQPEFHHAPG